MPACVLTNGRCHRLVSGGPRVRSQERSAMEPRQVLRGVRILGEAVEMRRWGAEMK